MTEKELFKEVLDNLTNKYNLTVERPYNDEYIVIKKDNETLGEFNTSGYNLLYNLKRLCNALEVMF